MHDIGMLLQVEDSKDVLTLCNELSKFDKHFVVSAELKSRCAASKSHLQKEHKVTGMGDRNWFTEGCGASLPN